MTTNIRHKTLKVKTFLGKAIDKKRNAVIPRPHYTLYIIHYTLYIIHYTLSIISKFFYHLHQLFSQADGVAL